MADTQENKTKDDGIGQRPDYYDRTGNDTYINVTGVGKTYSTTSNEKPNRRTHNPLSKFSSYTYNIGLYGLTPDAYNNWNRNGKWLTKDLELLIQSGGSNRSTYRNINFYGVDFTIDDLEITSLISAKESRTAGNQSNFKFKIYEPFGMTFPSRLVRAQTEIQQQANIKRSIKQQVQALATPLLIVIRFYGYDEEGKIIKNMQDPNQNGYTRTDSEASFERAFPILISKFSFRLDNKVTIYDVEAKMINEQVGFGTKRGIIKTGFEISGNTVASAIEELLVKVNQQQQDLTVAPKDPKKPKDQTVADVYKIIFQDKSGIGNAEIVDRDFYVKHYTPMPNVTRANQINVRLSESGAAQTVDKDKRTVKIAEGTSILTAIDQIITQSTFVKKSLDALDKEEIKKKQVQDSTVNNNSPDPAELFWYHVIPSTKIIGYDESRNEYAYEIVYNIVKYRVPYVKSLYLNKATKYHGPHKIYEYYYSGKNTEIIDYSCNYNLAYYNLGALASQAANAPNTNDTTPNSQEPGQDANSTGTLPGARDLINTFKTYLYSPKDQLDASITILGDPDYLMPSQAGSEKHLFNLWYGEDYTINPSSGQVFIEIGFKQVDDYFHGTGTLDPTDNIVFWIYPQGSDIEKQTEGRMVYMLNTVTSKFSGGVFRQDLKTIIPSFSNQPGDPNAARATTKKVDARPAPSAPNVVKDIKLPFNSSTGIMDNIYNVTNDKVSNPKDDNMSHSTGIKINNLSDPFREVGKKLKGNFSRNYDFVKKNLFNRGN